MNWKTPSSMREAMSQIPDGAAQDAGYSTPDIYGRASQLYLSLEKAVGQTSRQDDEDVRLWRGFLTLLALRHAQNLPLEWQEVTLSVSDTVSNALRNPGFDRNVLLFDPDNIATQNYTWNGTNFFVLRWTPEKGTPRDIAIYSPLTLLYPVADWRSILHNICGYNEFLSRFFDKNQDNFRSCGVLREDERIFVYLWLEKMGGFLKSGNPSSVGANETMQNLKAYQNDLLVKGLQNTLQVPTDDDMDFDDFHEGAGALSGGLPSPLWKAYRLKGGEVFADQICIFKISTRNAAQNPFSADGCQFAEKYEIRDCPERDCKWYAFLPVHPDRRATCASDGLAEQIDMRYIRDRTTQSEKICVTVALPSGLKRTREYPIDKAQSPEKGHAVFYVDSTIPLDMNSWPLIAVWPGTIGEHWKKYYVARGEFAADCLRIYGEEGTGVVSSTVTKGHNPLAVQLQGSPDAIPFVRLYPDGNGGSIPLSVGVVTPKMEQVGSHAPVSIEVAVDFGTSSTRVYWQTEGQNNPDELFVQDDGPVEVTGFSVRADDGTLVLNRNKADTMSRDFISPYDPSAEHVPLFSMFQRSSERPLVVAPPILEGVIYQPSPQEKMKDLKRLITDLKWNGQHQVYFTAFLQQLCLHIMSMLYKGKHVNNIVWRFALPKAMDPSQVDMMNMIWKGANKRPVKTGGDAQNSIQGFLEDISGKEVTQKVEEPLTESVASSLYFNEFYTNYVQADQGYLVVDIGGGSTDVALWQGAEGAQTADLKWHSSVAVAGRDMFTTRMEQNIDEMSNGTGIEDLDNLVQNWRSADSQGGKAYVDRLLSSYETELLYHYSNAYHGGAQWARDMHGGILRSMSLLMFSLGYQTGVELLDEKLTPPRAPGYFTICFGGRGSNILEWLMLNKQQHYPELQDFFREGVKASGADWPDVEIDIQKSQDPKCEVAKGLLVYSTIPAAEKVKLRNGGWNFQSSSATMPDNSYPIQAAEGFLTAFNARFPEFAANYTNCDIMDEHGNLISGIMAGAAKKEMRGKQLKDDAFRVLMKSIHDTLT